MLHKFYVYSSYLNLFYVIHFIWRKSNIVWNDNSFGDSKITGKWMLWIQNMLIEWINALVDSFWIPNKSSWVQFLPSKIKCACSEAWYSLSIYLDMYLKYTKHTIYSKSVSCFYATSPTLYTKIRQQRVRFSKFSLSHYDHNRVILESLVPNQTWTRLSSASCVLDRVGKCLAKLM